MVVEDEEEASDDNDSDFDAIEEGEEPLQWITKDEPWSS